MPVRPLKNQRLSDDEFFREREEVLAQWPTGKDVDLEDGIAFTRSLPDSKVFAKKLAVAKRNGDTLIQSYNGTPTLEGQIELVKHLVEEGGADLCSTHVDAFTRNQMYPKAKEALKESEKLGKAMLNGFPVLIHGVAANRKLIEAYPVPSRVSGCSCDWRLNAEVAFAGGHTSITSGPFFPFFGYNRDTTIELTIRNWQYLYRLIGYYEQGGAQIVSRPDGVASACYLSPPSTGDSCKIIEALLGAEQGVKRVSFVGWTGGNLAQDLAGAIVLPRLGREYLDRFGHQDVEIFTMSHSMLGRYPYDPARAFAVLSSGPLVAALAGLQEVCIMTIDEAHEIPGKENNAASMRCGKMVINLYKGQKLGLEETGAVKTEVLIQEMELRSIVDRVLELGDGDVAVGSVRAVEAGVLDMPFSGARGAAHLVLGVRDAQGAQRFLNHGNLPFSKEIVDFHKEKIAERARKQNREISYDAVIKDLVSVSEGQLVSRNAE
ncbi:methylaspartate mutase subunit E [Chloroflexota bacterium]